jgi:KamA family protein
MTAFNSSNSAARQLFMTSATTTGRGETRRPRTYDRRSLGEIRQLHHLSSDIVESIRLATLVFPFKVNEYALENLIDWSCAPDDPMFRLLFPTADMLSEPDREHLARLTASGARQGEITAAVERIRASMNPDPSDQSANVPFFDGQSTEGVQHKYRETVLFFPKQGQTCHSYCSFCYRWPQFVAGAAPKFESNNPNELLAYLRSQPEVSDLLLTGGDPMVMSARKLAGYLEPLKRPEFAHVQVVRIGTKALTYRPHRFLDEDSDELLRVLQGLVAAGKHVALMAHVNHWRELVPAPVEEAITRLRQAGIVIRTQSPLLRHINDAAETWRRNWAEQVRLGLIPYYMFVERDTGASQYFGVPLAQALRIYQEATRELSGLGRTARGPVMSAGPGKVHIVGTITHNGRPHFVLNFIQARNPDWLNRLFLAEYSETATWLKDLRPPEGSSNFFFEAEYSAFLEKNRRAAVGTPLDTIRVTIVGGGPRGLNILQNIVTEVRKAPPDCIVDIHLVEPGEPGEGSHPSHQMDCLVTNTLACQITASLPRDMGQLDAGHTGPSFTEWARS